MSYDRNWQRTTTTTRRGGARYPPPPPGSHNRQHSIFGYWVPLVALSTIAVGGLAAWIWSERSSHDEGDYPYEKPPRPPVGPGGPYPPQGSQPYPGPPGGQGMPPPVGGQQQQQPYRPPPGGEASSYYGQSTSQTRETETEQRTDQTFIGRMSGVMRRTPSPQQFFDSASKQVAAAGAAAGAALSSIMEEDHDDHRALTSYDDQGRHELRSGEQGERREDREGFSDHERWSEEADEIQRRNTIETASGKRIEAAKNEEKAKGRLKRTVAVVINADFSDGGVVDEDVFHTEHGSILSHLPHEHDASRTELFVLIFAPNLKALPPVDYAPSNLGSSYSQISTPAATPGEELQSISPHLKASAALDPTFDAVYGQAVALVSHPTQILPFTTPDGYVHLLRHLAPQLVYVSDSLAGPEGQTVAGLKGWVGHTILVAGDEGHGGLADTETETEDERSGTKKSKKRWYDNSPLVGLGKEIEVVDAARVGDDWARRVTGRD